MRWIMGSVALVLAMPATAQSMRECHRSDGSVYLTHQQCTTPQPYVGIVRKCIAPGGAVSFQQEPCAPGAKQAALRDATPEPPLSTQQRQAQAAKVERDRRESAYLSRLAGTDWIGKPQPRVYTSNAPDQRDRQRANCNNARQNRDGILARNTHPSAAYLIQLNDMVNRACKGL
jgi:hypothetical protein